MLLSWLQLKPKPPLRTKPEVVSDYVERKEFTDKFSKILTEHRFVLLYGLPKIGKSQFVSRYIDRRCYIRNSDTQLKCCSRRDPCDVCQNVS